MSADSRSIPPANYNLAGHVSTAHFGSISGLYINESRMLIVYDHGVSWMDLVTYEVTPLIGSGIAGAVDNPYTAAILSNGSILLGNYGGGNILRIEPNGTHFVVGVRPTISGIVQIPDGRILILDIRFDCVTQLHDNGTFTPVAAICGNFGYADGIGPAAQFNYAQELFHDAAFQRILIADGGNNRSNIIKGL